MPIEVLLTGGIRDAIDEVFRLDSAADDLKNELQNWHRSGTNSDAASRDAHVYEVEGRNDSCIPFKTVKKVFETLKKGICMLMHILAFNDPPLKYPPPGTINNGLIYFAGGGGGQVSWDTSTSSLGTVS